MALTYTPPDVKNPGVWYQACADATTTTFTSQVRSIYVGGGGNVAVVGMDDLAVTFVGVPTGTWLPIMIKAINKTNTTATSIVAIH